MPIDTTLIGALHVNYLGRRDLAEDEPLHHTLFQTSTIDALLDGYYDGDVSFAELEEHGDFGLGTLDALDGEMVALDGNFYQIDADGRVHPVNKTTKTPFAVVTVFEPNLTQTLDAAMDLAALYARVDELVGDTSLCCAVRVDGRFEHVRTRSVPRQRKPYPPRKWSRTSRSSRCPTCKVASSASDFPITPRVSTSPDITCTSSPRTGTPAGTCSNAG